MRVVWTDQAREALGLIDDALSSRDPRVADALLERLFLRAEALVDFPDQGPALPERPGTDLRHLVVDGFRMIYRRLPDECRILAVLRPRQRLIGSQLTDR